MVEGYSLRRRARQGVVLIRFPNSATILYRVAEFLKTDMPRNAYSDSIEYYADKDSISSWAFDAVFHMREMGIMEGTGGNQFSPKTAYTVEQAITTVVRLCEK